MLQNILKPNAAIEETTRTTPAYSFWGYTWRLLFVTLVATVPAFFAFLGIGFVLVFSGNIAIEALPVNAILSMALSVCLLAIIHLYCHKASGRSYASMGLVKKGATKQYLLGLLFGLAVCAINLGIAVGFGVFEVNKNLDTLIIVINLLCAMIFAPISEMLTTGYYFGGVASSKGVLYALFGCTCVSLFLGLTGIQNGIIYVISSILMVLFSYLYFLYSGSIWGAAAFSGVLSLVDRSMFIAEDAPLSYLAVSKAVTVLTPVLGITVLLFLLWRRSKKV